MREDWSSVVLLMRLRLMFPLRSGNAKETVAKSSAFGRSKFAMIRPGADEAVVVLAGRTTAAKSL